MEAIPWRKNQLFEVFDGELSADQVYEQIMKNDTGGTVPRAKRFFCNNGEIFHQGGKAHVLSNQWGQKTLDTADSLAKMFPNPGIEVKPAT